MIASAFFLVFFFSEPRTPCDNEIIMCSLAVVIGWPGLGFVAIVHHNIIFDCFGVDTPERDIYLAFIFLLVLFIESRRLDGSFWIDMCCGGHDRLAGLSRAPFFCGRRVHFDLFYSA